MPLSFRPSSAPAEVFSACGRSGRQPIMPTSSAPMISEPLLAYVGRRVIRRQATGKPSITTSRTNSKKSDTNSPTYEIWPCLDLPACVIHEAHGGAFLAQPLDQPPSESRQRNFIKISNALTVCAVRDDLFVYFRSKLLHSDLYGFTLSREPTGLHRIEGPGRKICAADKGIKHSTAAAAHFVDGKSKLVLFTITGEILRYSQS